MKIELKETFKKALFLLLFSLIYLGIGIVAAILISNKFDYNMQDVMAYEGLIILVIGIMMSMKGNPSGASISRMGSTDANLSSYLNNEIVRQEREINPYHKAFLKNNVVEFAFSNLSFILGGIFIILFCLIFL